MPLSRNARQARQMRGASPRRVAGDTWTPRIDVFGTLRLPEGEFRCRLIEYAPSTFAAFTTDFQNQITFRTAGDFNIKGRIMTATLEGTDSEVKFQKAGCGCETPHELRTSRSKLLENISSAPAPTPDEFMQQLEDIPGAFLQLAEGALETGIIP